VGLVGGFRVGVDSGNLPRGLRTDRLILRRWLPDDRVPFAALNSDPRVMEHFPAALSREESDALADRIDAHFTRYQFGLWAMEIPQRTSFAGFVGLALPGFEAHFTPCVEIGWRLAAAHWGFGYATEAARAVLTFGFERLALDEIVSFTTVENYRSRRVMERIGMVHDPGDDFDHPALPDGHPLRRHVLYRRRRIPARAGSDD
jgi:RimJ/RimL family protein N-acetyltransferase